MPRKLWLNMRVFLFLKKKLEKRLKRDYQKHEKR